MNCKRANFSAIKWGKYLTFQTMRISSPGFSLQPLYLKWATKSPQAALNMHSQWLINLFCQYISKVTVNAEAVTNGDFLGWYLVATEGSYNLLSTLNLLVLIFRLLFSCQENRDGIVLKQLTAELSVHQLTHHGLGKSVQKIQLACPWKILDKFCFKDFYGKPVYNKASRHLIAPDHGSCDQQTESSDTYCTSRSTITQSNCLHQEDNRHGQL